MGRCNLWKGSPSLEESWSLTHLVTTTTGYGRLRSLSPQATNNRLFSAPFQRGTLRLFLSSLLSSQVIEPHYLVIIQTTQKPVSLSIHECLVLLWKGEVTDIRELCMFHLPIQVLESVGVLLLCCLVGRVGFKG